jgi:ribonuclease G
MPGALMGGELLISPGPGEWRAAWVEAGEPVELYVERGDSKPAGSLHLGRVVRVVPGLDALFVDIGDERPALLRLRDAGDVSREEGARLVVQVRREAWQEKAPLLTAKIAAPDLPALAERAARLDPPAQLTPAPGFAANLKLRLPAAPERIVSDDVAIVPELRAAFPGVDVARQEAADWPVDLDAAFEAGTAPTLALRGGGSVHFEELRGLIYVDVDTGTPEGGSAERVALAVNRAAAGLIARQIRLCNLSGGIAIDFVGMERRGGRESVRATMEAALAPDPAKPQVLGWTRLGHLEIVRPRRGRSLGDALLRMRAGGPPEKQPVTLAFDMLRAVQREARANPATVWLVRVSPEVAAALVGPAAAALRGLEARLGRDLPIETEPGRGSFDIRPL